MGVHLTADITTRIITLTTAPVLENGDMVVDIDVKVDMYSDLKEDWQASSTLRKLDFPIQAVGGQDKPGDVDLGTTYFVNSDWKFAPYEATHRLRINGNIYSVDGTTPFNTTAGAYNVIIENNLSALVEVASIEGGGGTDRFIWETMIF
ncbi:hypothetical protein DRH27_04330 [Candidatus Falkowbacteria bacterium]|nr:MAG: hypothetical protein DRH27_04330 [Candidatus Falkowbacteria bacterium]